MRRRRREPGTDVAVAASAPALSAGRPSASLAEVVDVERAMRLVRFAAALIAAAAVLGSRSTAGGALAGPAAAAAILATAMVIGLFTIWTGRRGWSTFAPLSAQLLDVAASLGLVVLLDPALDGASWILLLLPIVMGGVRFGAAGTLLAWTLSCAGYLVLAVTGVLEVSDDAATTFGTCLQRFAFLLALAVPVAALTQWLRHRWEQQRTLTDAASNRARRLEIIETMARSFIGASEPNLLANLADAGVRLGFSTVTITLHSEARSMTVAAVGESRRLPTDDVAIRPEPGETLVTHWTGDPEFEDLTSVSILLDATGNAIALHGWTTGELDEDAAHAFGLLGAHAQVALQAARTLADLGRQARQDPLTGLLNRRAFDEHLDQRAELGRQVALLVLDVDHFKQINDTYGHPAGDKVLRVIGERLRGATRHGDEPISAAVARIGGDEFALVLTGVPLDVVVDVADRIETSMRQPVAVPGAQVVVSFSIGIADADGGWTPRDLITAADEATYQAKTHGRNRTCWAPGPVGAPTDEISPTPPSGPSTAPAPAGSFEALTEPVPRPMEDPAPATTRQRPAP